MKPSRRFFLAGVAWCAAPAFASAQSPVHLSVGTAPIDSGMTPIVVQRAGFYRRYALDVDIRVMNSGVAVAAAVVGGALQIGSSSLMGLIQAHVKGLTFQRKSSLSTIARSTLLRRSLVTERSEPTSVARSYGSRTSSALRASCSNPNTKRPTNSGRFA